jgi:hypothetical protein
LKVPWSRGPGTKEVQKSRDLKIGKVLGQWKSYYPGCMIINYD